ncbi:Nucleolar MIF4G domain-containing protein 1 [Babesia ovata]|uniref:Nucleolar MIF4G domain-containing protein 1 n=1 Tax=Babesia ovata TaxID=189622 RepID=A0A2H6K9F9_9APIC|nr:Nucleolar MIF4G domain-containing protein 1 [Babesia ovata]GBE59644.1 Nucleolar MIF4G domain-containing protein 1 [Babesia ovata]
MVPRSRKSDPIDDPRFKTQKQKSRKSLRKAQRKADKQRHHQNMIQWKQRRSNKPSPQETASHQEAKVKPQKRKMDQNNEVAPPTNQPVEKSYDELEIEYLERKLRKNRKSSAKAGDLFQSLKKEFVNDGFDEEFLDFLSEISNMAEKGKKSKEGTSIDKAQTKRNAGKSKTRDHDEEFEDDDDEEGDEGEGEDEEADGSEEDEDEDSEGEDEEEDDEDGEDEEDAEEDEDEDIEGSDDSDGDIDGNHNGEDELPPKKKVRFDLPPREMKEKSKQKSEIRKRPIKTVPIDEKLVEETKKKQRGLLNRISEGNFTIVVKEIIKLYNHVLSSESNDEGKEHLLAVDELIEDLCDCTVKMVIENESSVISLVAMHTALICALCNTVGINVGYVYCHKLLKTLEAALPVLFENQDGKELSYAKLVTRNSVMSFAVISHLDMLDLEIIFFLIKNISRENITEHVAQILMVLLRYTGHKMKVENPTSFHNVIGHLKKLLDKYKETHGDITQSRLRFFEQEIESFKLSKEKKPLETFDFLKNIIKGEFRHSAGTTNPQISLQTLLKFTKESDGPTLPSHVILHNLDTASLMAVKSSKIKGDNSTESLLQKAAALRLYSNCQKSTFVAIMGAISPQHAVERIMALGIKPVQYTEVVYTVVHSLMSEKLYNEYYTEVNKNLARLPAATGKRFTRACVCTLIAVIEHLHEKKPRKCAHVGRLFAAMVAGNVLELKLLKFVKKEHIDSDSVEAFLKSLFGNLVTLTPASSEEHVIAQLMSLANVEMFDILCELWLEYIQDHCMDKVLSAGSGNVLMEACRRIFGAKNLER